MNLFALLNQAAKRYPASGAIYSGTRKLWTYEELRSRALRLAAGLRRRWAAGERICIASENRPEYLELFFGIWAAELVAVPINAKLHPSEMAAIVADSAACATFVSPTIARSLASAQPQDGLGQTVITGEAEYEALLIEELEPPLSTPPETLAWLFYTSGTTGKSKGAMLSHRNLLAMAVAHLADVDRPDEGASLIHAAPMSHGSGLYILPYTARGVRHVVPDSSGFDAAEFLDLCSQHPGCRAFLAPTMVRRVRVQAEESGRGPKNLRTVIYGGAPMYVEELKKCRAVLGPILAQIYGQGEAPMTITSLRKRDHDYGDDKLLGSVGWPRTGMQVRVVDSKGHDLPTAEIGEIVCRGDVVMSGYWGNPNASAETLRGGWLYTGDMGFFDVAGRLTLCDRTKDVIISGGSNIYPREVEEALLRHPGVGEACAVGQRDPEWGEIVVAFVVQAPGADLDTRMLDAHCLQHIARFKRPRRYFFVDSLPKNSYGKVLKRQLVQSLSQPLPTG